MKKIRSLVGFAIKSRKILLGQSKIKYYRDDIFLIILSNDASKNLEIIADNVSKRKDCQVIKLDTNLDDITNMENVKILAITDYNLASGIINEYANLN